MLFLSWEEYLANVATAVKMRWLSWWSRRLGRQAKETRSGFRRADYESWQNSLRNFYKKKARARRFAKKAGEEVSHYVSVPLCRKFGNFSRRLLWLSQTLSNDQNPSLKVFKAWPENVLSLPSTESFPISSEPLNKTLQGSTARNF